MAKRWHDEGFITAVRSYGESSAIVSILTKNNGRHKGFIRLSKQNRALIQLGNHVHVHWRSRLAEHLGQWSLESLREYTATLLNQPGPLNGLTIACQWIELVIPEREVNPGIFQNFSELMRDLDSPVWLEAFISFEVCLLKTLGFGLDFSHCAVTGNLENLVYVSPRTGRAVCEEVGKPYHDKLLPLPSFLTCSHQSASKKELNQGLDLTRYFFERYVLSHYGIKLPYNREKLYQ